MSACKAYGQGNIYIEMTMLGRVNEQILHDFAELEWWKWPNVVGFPACTGSIYGLAKGKVYRTAKEPIGLGITVRGIKIK